MNTPIRLPLSALLLAILFVAPITLPSAFAQSRADDCNYSPSSVAITAHLQSMLQSRDAATRLAALQDLNALAHSSHRDVKTLHLNAGVVRNGFDGDLKVVTPGLLRAYQLERNPAARMMASNALYLIGDEESLERLIVLNANEPNARVKKHTNTVLASYFTQQYPELSGKKKVNAASIKKARRAKMRVS